MENLFNHQGFVKQQLAGVMKEVKQGGRFVQWTNIVRIDGQKLDPIGEVKTGYALKTKCVKLGDTATLDDAYETVRKDISLLRTELGVKDYFDTHAIYTIESKNGSGGKLFMCFRDCLSDGRKLSKNE